MRLCQTRSCRACTQRLQPAAAALSMSSSKRGARRSSSSNSSSVVLSAADTALRSSNSSNSQQQPARAAAAAEAAAWPHLEGVIDGGQQLVDLGGRVVHHLDHLALDLARELWGLYDMMRLPCSAVGCTNAFAPARVRPTAGLHAHNKRWWSQRASRPPWHAVPASSPRRAAPLLYDAPTHYRILKTHRTHLCNLQSSHHAAPRRTWQHPSFTHTHGLLTHSNTHNTTHLCQLCQRLLLVAQRLSVREAAGRHLAGHRVLPVLAAVQCRLGEVLLIAGNTQYEWRLL